jgi:tetratricopeptide (TPR) repeat protein
VRLHILELCKRKAWDVARDFTLGHAQRPVVGPRALSFYAVALVDNRQPGAIDFIRTYSTALASDDLAWGNISHAYFTLEEYDKVITWTQDWQVRSGRESWMLLNRAAALHYLKKKEAALQVHRDALSLPPDYTQPWHALWLAFEQACDGKETAAFLAEYKLSELESFYKFLYSLVQTLEKSRQQASLPELRRLLVAGIGKPANRALSPLERRLLRSAGKAMLRTSIRWPVKLWSLWLFLVGAS